MPRKRVSGADGQASETSFIHLSRREMSSNEAGSGLQSSSPLLSLRASRDAGSYGRPQICAPRSDRGEGADLNIIEELEELFRLSSRPCDPIIEERGAWMPSLRSLAGCPLGRLGVAFVLLVDQREMHTSFPCIDAHLITGVLTASPPDPLQGNLALAAGGGGRGCGRLAKLSLDIVTRHGMSCRVESLSHPLHPPNLTIISRSLSSPSHPPHPSTSPSTPQSLPFDDVLRFLSHLLLIAPNSISPNHLLVPSCAFSSSSPSS